MFKSAIAGAVMAGAASLVLAPIAGAWTTDQDTTFVLLVEGKGIGFPTDAIARQAGEEIANDLAAGISPVAECNKIYANTGASIGVQQARDMVVAAEIAYFGTGGQPV